MATLNRMWINQPSTLQEHHNLHGTRVLAHYEWNGIYRIYFLAGNVISMQVIGDVLSEGWRE